jgi:hypothetical protein
MTRDLAGGPVRWASLIGSNPGKRISFRKEDTLKSVQVLCALLLSIAVSPAWATTYTMGYQPPGGVTFSSSGPGSGADGGKTFSYTGFNSGAYAKLYWGLNAVANVNEGTPNGNMIFLNYNPSTGIATWVSTSDWVFTSGVGGGCCSTPTQLLVQLQHLHQFQCGLPGHGISESDDEQGSFGYYGRSERTFISSYWAVPGDV